MDNLPIKAKNILYLFTLFTTIKRKLFFETAAKQIDHREVKQKNRGQINGQFHK